MLRVLKTRQSLVDYGSFEIPIILRFVGYQIIFRFVDEIIFVQCPARVNLLLFRGVVTTGELRLRRNFGTFDRNFRQPSRVRRRRRTRVQSSLGSSCSEGAFGSSGAADDTSVKSRKLFTFSIGKHELFGGRRCGALRARALHSFAKKA